MPDSASSTIGSRDRIICFGDVIDDIVVVPMGSIRDDTDTPSTIRFRPGGSAANTAAWLGNLGAPVDLVGAVGIDDAPRHSEQLPGVTTHLAANPSLPTGTIVVIVDGQRRHMLTERGANRALDPNQVTDALLAAARVLHITGHTLLNVHGIGGLIERAQAAGVAISIAPGSAGFIADYGVEAFAKQILGATIVFASLEEGRILTGLDDPAAIAAALPFDIAVVTQGTAGVIVAHADRVFAVPATPAEVIDPTGAGDAFCAGFLETWLRTDDLRAAAIAGTQVAARAVAILGGRPE